MAARLKAAMDATAFRFVLTLGVVNLFADMTYEGGGSINGLFLGTLGRVPLSSKRCFPTRRRSLAKAGSSPSTPRWMKQARQRGLVDGCDPIPGRTPWSEMARGSAAVGLLYERSHVALVMFAVAAQLCALLFFILGHRRQCA